MTKSLGSRLELICDGIISITFDVVILSLLPPHLKLIVTMIAIYHNAMDGLIVHLNVPTEYLNKNRRTVSWMPCPATIPLSQSEV